MKKGFIGLVFLWVTQICCAQFSLRSDQPIKLASSKKYATPNITFIWNTSISAMTP